MTSERLYERELQRQVRVLVIGLPEPRKVFEHVQSLSARERTWKFYGLDLIDRDNESGSVCGEKLWFY